MFKELFSWEDFVVSDMLLIFHDVETRVQFGDLPPGSRFTFATVNLQVGWVEFSNVNQELEQDDEISMGRFPLKLLISSAS